METKTLNLILNVLKIGISAIGIILFIMILAGNDGVVGTALGITYIAMGICTLAAVGFGIYLFVSNVKNNKGALIGIVGFVAIILLSYLTASDAVPAIKQQVSPGTAKMVGGGIAAFYVLTLGVIGSIIFAEVRKVLK